MSQRGGWLYVNVPVRGTMIDIRKLAAIDIAFLGKPFTIAEFVLGGVTAVAPAARRAGGGDCTGALEAPTAGPDIGGRPSGAAANGCGARSGPGSVRRR